MTKQQLTVNLCEDLRNEYTHMHFYLHSAALVTGLHREEIREFLIEQAEGEFKHIQEFANLIVGLGGIPSCWPHEFPTHYNPYNILTYALKLEEEVVSNYVLRMKEAKELGGVDGSYVEIFLENQILDSRADADNIRQMLKGENHSH